MHNIINSFGKLFHDIIAKFYLYTQVLLVNRLTRKTGLFEIRLCEK